MRPRQAHLSSAAVNNRWDGSRFLLTVFTKICAFKRRSNYSEKPAFDLIAEYRPARCVDLRAAEQLQVRTGADSLNEQTHGFWLAAMLRPTAFQSTWDGPVAKPEISANAEQQELVCNAPVIAPADFVLNPNKARLIAKTLGLNYGTHAIEKHGLPSLRMNVGHRLSVARKMHRRVVGVRASC